MNKTIAEYVKGCSICQQMKPDRNPTRPPLQPIGTTKDATPFSQCSVDFITDLPPTEGYDAIMVIVDHGLSKAISLTPCTKTIDSTTTAQIFHEKIYSRYGVPRKIISDRGTQFSSKVFQELCRLLQIKSAMSTAYHPQTDGQTERMNQQIEVYLRIYCMNDPRRWVSAQIGRAHV